MFKLFSSDDSFILPNGKTFKGTELKERPGYEMLKMATCVVDVTDGILYSYLPLGAFCSTYDTGYDESQPENSFNTALSVYKDRIAAAQNDAMANFNVRMRAAVQVAQMSAMSFTDEQALEVKDIYPEYQVDHAYKQGDFFTHEGELYKVNQAHTSASQWEPGSVGTESLYTHLTLNEDGYPIWKQPTGAHDAYNKGDIVEYNGELYKALIDGNAYSPDTYPAGWEKYTEPTE